MKIRTFIDRPILSVVISVVILLVGLIGLSQLPIEQFPEIAPPTVSVSATYTGANAETVQKSGIERGGKYDVYDFVCNQYRFGTNYYLFPSRY